MMPGALRQHARLLRERYAGDGSRDGEAARIHADAMAARAEIMEAEANIPSPAPEEDCTLRDTYPIIGRVVRRGGSIKEIEHPWDERHVRALNRRGIDIVWEWCHDPRAEERQGSLIRIYIGTRYEGPRVMWCDGLWRTLKSRGNYGKNWACGGTWQYVVGCKESADLNEVAPDLARAIEEVKDGR